MRAKRPPIHWPCLQEEVGKVVERLRKVWIENLPWSKCITVWDTTETFFYADPPYRAKASAAYRHNFTDDDHRAMAEVLRSQVRGKWLVSYNDDRFIRRIYRGKGIRMDSIRVKYGLQGGLWKVAPELLIRNF